MAKLNWKLDGDAHVASNDKGEIVFIVSPSAYGYRLQGQGVLADYIDVESAKQAAENAK